MAKIHKEGYDTILTVIIFLTIFNVLLYYLFSDSVITVAISILSIISLGFVISFFRSPKREMLEDDDLIICPADGKVVVIEETVEREYFQDKRIQVSVFMSPSNVHINRNPISGIVRYFKYHPGKYLVAWHPKSSTDNESTSIVVENENFAIMMRQIAGKVARRIVSYVKVGNHVKQGDEFGFIKFGSRVDLYLPLETKIDVSLEQKVKGGITVIGRLERKNVNKNENRRDS